MAPRKCECPCGPGGEPTDPEPPPPPPSDPGEGEGTTTPGGDPAPVGQGPVEDSDENRIRGITARFGVQPTRHLWSPPPDAATWSARMRSPTQENPWLSELSSRDWTRKMSGACGLTCACDSERDHCGCASCQADHSDYAALQGGHNIQYAETPCLPIPGDKKGDPPKGGQLGSPKYTAAYYKLSLCARMLIDEHEAEHRADPALQKACNTFAPAEAARNARRTNKKIQDAYHEARNAFSTVVHNSHCAMWEEDLKCLEKLKKDCCNRPGAKKKMPASMGKGKQGAIECCSCKDLDDLINQITAWGTAQGCAWAPKK